MESDQEIHIIGAGFSGLTIAYYLQKAGISHIKVFEKSAFPGGLISSYQTPFGLVETAANTIISNSLLEELLKDISLKPLYPNNESKKRFIYIKEKFRRWPLTFKDTLVFIFGLLKLLLIKKKYRPSVGQTVEQWTTQVFNKNISHNLISPGLQGIYASSADSLSSSLIIGKFFNKKKKHKSKGIISFINGMGELPLKLESYLKNNGVEFYYNHSYKKINNNHITIVATSLKHATSLHREIKSRFSNVPLKNVSTVTLFLNQGQQLVQGFGVLYPRKNKIHTLGSLMNDKIFKNRSINSASETWIIENIKENDQAVLDKVLIDRKKISKDEVPLKQSYVKTWEGAFPLYGKELEKSLRSKDQLEKENIFLTGNYLGQLGLSGILTYNNELAIKIRNIYEEKSITSC